MPKPIATTLLRPLDAVRRALPGLPMDNFFNSADYAEESSIDAVAPFGVPGYAQLGIKPSKVRGESPR